MNKRKLILIIPYLLFFSCEKAVVKEKKQIESVQYNDFYGTEFFKEVQLSGIFEDSKTFVDCTPIRPLAEIISEYQASRGEKSFVLADFVNENFKLPQTVQREFVTDTTQNMYSHITGLWPLLTREKDNAFNNGSLIPLPHQYVVPGGRFREIYYWDSYFTMLGLMANDQLDLATQMLDNFAFMIDSLGFIPNGNRAYYLGRSQPPFFAFMVDLIAGKNRDLFLKYQPQLIKEYDFWMKGAEQLSDSSPANNRTVLLETGEVLNRYYDKYTNPRPESFREDYKLAQSQAGKRNETEMYRHLRAGAESGWDYSSRWLADSKSMNTIQTADIIPVDLNALLYFLELKIAQSYNWQGNKDTADIYLGKAEQRKNAINSILWSEKAGTYMDYNYRDFSHTGIISMAMAYPLFVQIAPKDKARKVLNNMTEHLMMPGGLVTTTNETGQQWDYPNAWAPLQWIGMQAYFNYGKAEEGVDLINRWLSLNRKVYNQTGKMMEKYNVVDTTLQAGGGEYPLQDGFGWTNGVALAMKQILERKEKAISSQPPN
ncbi:periplasmic trehalase [Marivirga lumbricoides]|uniref:Periplasmic trehalase n=1 Tax=Marivirga lumbricoides TaxID=1046115 RepID=A0ABQ1MXD4_9BACT|nr:periplasmic trehalase [Marivirga lumbricoides]